MVAIMRTRALMDERMLNSIKCIFDPGRDISVLLINKTRTFEIKHNWCFGICYF